MTTEFQLKRFVWQVAFEEHCLTGAKFFKITKATVLEVKFKK